MSAIQLLSNSLALAPSTIIPFSAAGGTGPYTFTVLEGGVGGFINPVSGLYTAPAAYGSDLIQVEDSLGDFTNVRVLIGSYIQLVCDVIQKSMGLEQGQVYLYNQKIDIPNDSRLYISVGEISCKPFGNSIKTDGSGGGVNTIQSTNFQALLDIDILSRSIEALNRKEEVLLALNSQYSESQQELNGFFIAKLSSAFLNLSELDGAAIPYRFKISVNIQYQITKSTPVDYYDSFQPVSVVTNS